LFEVRGLYAKAVADRESLDARTARAEAEKAAAENNWQRAKAQVGWCCFPFWLFGHLNTQ
jgi:hypothetical protein